MPQLEMDDFAALAQRIAAVASDVRGCLILSRDGLVLGAAHPAEDEDLAKQSWLRFASLGEPERSFVEFPDQVWAFVRRGSYAAFAYAASGVRPGILLDQLEQALLAAEAARTKLDTLKVPDAPAAPSGRPRTSLHMTAGRPEPAPATATPAPAAASAPAQAGQRPDPRPDPRPDHNKKDKKRDGKKGDPELTHPSTSTDTSSAGQKPSDADSSDDADGSKGSDGPPQDPASVSHLQREPQKLVSSDPEPKPEDESEVDRVLLAKEFSGLLQMNEEDAEGS